VSVPDTTLNLHVHVTAMATITTRNYIIGRFLKISIPYQGRPVGILRARGGSLNWKSEGMGGYLRLEFRRHGGF